MSDFYFVNVPDWHDEDEWNEFEAFDPEMAAEEFVENHCEDSPPYKEIDVLVKDELGQIKKFKVSCEATLNFYSREVK